MQQDEKEMLFTGTVFREPDKDTLRNGTHRELSGRPSHRR